MRENRRVESVDPVPAVRAVRAAVEQIRGRPLSWLWPPDGLPAGGRVLVVHDASWAGPWRDEFEGTIDSMGAPEPVRHHGAFEGELAYWVEFDEPQVDSNGDGPYRKALIWGRHLRPLHDHSGKARGDW